jgi:hypothetical protein
MSSTLRFLRNTIKPVTGAFFFFASTPRRWFAMISSRFEQSFFGLPAALANVNRYSGCASPGGGDGLRRRFLEAAACSGAVPCTSPSAGTSSAWPSTGTSVSPVSSSSAILQYWSYRMGVCAGAGSLGQYRLCIPHCPPAAPARVSVERVNASKENGKPSLKQISRF